MKCKKYKIMISCLVDNELNDSLKSKLLAHIKECSLCSKEFEKITKIKNIINKKGKTNADPFFETRIKERINSQIHTPAPKLRLKLSIAAALILCIVSITGIQLIKNYNSYYSADYMEINSFFDNELLTMYYY
ncbi:hypothetical protein ACFL4O_01585 [bacterium]